MDSNLNHAQKALAIMDVVLKKGDVEVRDDIASIDESFLRSARVQYYQFVGEIEEIEFEDSESGKNAWLYLFSYHAGARVVPSEEMDEATDKEYEPAIQIQSIFKSRYRAQEKLTEECVQAFSEHNVGFNVWPYWREFVQSSSLRIGMPSPIPVPLYKLSRPAGDQADIDK